MRKMPEKSVCALTTKGSSHTHFANANNHFDYGNIKAERRQEQQKHIMPLVV